MEKIIRLTTEIIKETTLFNVYVLTKGYEIENYHQKIEQMTNSFVKVLNLYISNWRMFYDSIESLFEAIYITIDKKRLLQYMKTYVEKKTDISMLIEEIAHMGLSLTDKMFKYLRRQEGIDCRSHFDGINSYIMGIIDSAGITGVKYFQYYKSISQ